MFKTKTFWGGVSLVAIGVGCIVTGNVSEGLISIGQGLTAIFIRHSISKLNEKLPTNAN